MKAKQLLPSINEKIAEFLLSGEFDKKIKHEIIFKLLKDSNKEEKYVDVFTSGYVMEAYLLKRDPREIRQQMIDTLESLPQIEDKRKIIKFSCAVTTMQQHDEALRWLDAEYQYDIELPFALGSERKSTVEELLSLDDFVDMFNDVELLLHKNELSRAKYILERWMSNRTPGEFFCFIKQCNEDEEIYALLKKWGKCARILEVVPEIIEYQEDLDKRATAYFYKGWLEEAVNYSGTKQIKYTVEKLGIFFTVDIESYIQHIIKRGFPEEIEYILDGNIRENFSYINRLSACAWVIQNHKVGLCKGWLCDIRDKGFDYISDSRFEQKNLNIDQRREQFKIIADLMYVLSYVSSEETHALISNAVAKSGFEKNSADYIVANNLLIAIAQITYVEQFILHKHKDDLNLNEFEQLLDIILEESYYYRCIGIETTLFRKKLLLSVIRISDILPQSFKITLKNKLISKAQRFQDVALFECYWTYLRSIGKTDLVEKFFDAWMGSTGKIWLEELSEREYISEILLKIAEKMGWQERTQKTIELLNARIGYVGHKDYSLFNPLQWLERIAESNPEIWKTSGCLLMNISDFASSIGDNRAFVQVGGTVAAIAAKAGRDSFLQFVRMVQKTKNEAKELVFDGIISALETDIFTEEELLHIWAKATEYFPIDEYAAPYDSHNTRNKIYCADVHEAINLCNYKSKYDKLEKSMKQIAPREYVQKRLNKSEHSCIIPVRWYESEYNDNMNKFMEITQNMNYHEIFEYIQTQFDKSEFSWDYIKYFIQIAEKIDDQIVLGYKPQIMQMLMKREKNSLEWDGCYRLYDALFPYLTDEEVVKLLQRVIDTYFYYQDKGWASVDYNLMTDLEHFSFAVFTRFGTEDNVLALQEILKMHCLWLKGEESLEISGEYVVGEEECTQDWSDFLGKL